ncbi:glycine dehydrogenase [Rhodotorula diobovata]|uniref:Glycine cleavage system H protein n=1 Tax=Rhodotorula diobovata TaxID=5288 RepID=A0A5C5G3K2_9BASI|nr:glycine dehydrogenase [Rhodotorula diobovata]
MFRTALRTATRPAFRPVVAPVARPFLLRTLVSKRYTPSHEWVSFDDETGLGTLGITHYAQKALGDIVYVELPASGTQVAAGESVGAIESVKAASDFYAPVSGQIKEVNAELEDAPDRVNMDAQGDGWLIKIQLSNPGEFDQLLSEEAYAAHVAGESESS